MLEKRRAAGVAGGAEPRGDRVPWVRTLRAPRGSGGPARKGPRNGYQATSVKTTAGELQSSRLQVCGTLKLEEVPSRLLTVG